MSKNIFVPTGMKNIDHEWDITFRPMIRTIVQDLMNKKPVSVSTEQTMDAYTKCFNLLTKQTLDAEIYERFAYHQDAMMTEILDQFLFENLQQFVVHWNVFTIIIKWFKMFFYYLYRLQNAEFPFYTYFCDLYLNPHARILFSGMVNVYQTRDMIDYPVCARIVECLKQLNHAYIADFEKLLLEKNASFYRQQYAVMLKESTNVHMYVDNVLRFMDVEWKTLCAFHMSDIWEKVECGILNIFVDAQSAWVLDEFATTFRSRDIRKITNQFEFLYFRHRSELFAIYGNIMDEILASFDMPSSIRDIVQLRKDETRFVDNVLHDQHLYTVLRESIRKYVNSQGYIDHFIRYIDKILRDYDRRTTPDDWTDIFDIFALIADKDVFSQTYREMMTYRLFDHYDEDEERLVLEHMESRTGTSYVFPMHTMLNEMRLNRTDSSVSRVTHVTVISALQWSVRSDHMYDVRFPSQIAKDIEIFNNSYYARYGQNKKLTYVPHLGRVEIRARFKGDSLYNLIMTPIQAIVLLTLTETPQTVEEIEEAVMNGQQSLMMVSLLLSLKDLVIRQQDNTWRINAGFTYKKRVVRLPIPNMKKKGKKETDTAISLQRGYVLDCLIVRIMKTHRVMEHNDLIVRVMKEVKTFEPDVRTIKRQIEKLIERDYIERDQSAYKYIL